MKITENDMALILSSLRAASNSSALSADEKSRTKELENVLEVHFSKGAILSVLEKKEFVRPSERIYNPKVWAKIRETWRGYSRLKLEADQAFASQATSNLTHEKFTDEYIRAQRPRKAEAIVIVLLKEIPRLIESNQPLSWPAEYFINTCLSKNLPEDLKTAEEMLEDAGFMKVQLLIDRATVTAVIT